MIHEFSLTTSTIKQAFRLLNKTLINQFLFLGVVGLMAAALEAAGVSLAFVLIQLVTDPAVIETMPFIKAVTKISVFESYSSGFVVSAILLAIFFLFKNIFLAYATFAQNLFTFRTSVFIAHDLMLRYACAPYERIIMRNSADLVNGVTQVAWAISSRIYGATAILIVETAVVISLFAILAFHEPFITIVASAFLLTILVGYLFLVKKFYTKWGARQIELSRGALKAVQECLGNLKIVQVFNQSAYFLNKFKSSREELAIIGTLVTTANSMPRLITETLMVWAIALVIIIALYQDRSPATILSTLGLFAFAGFRIMPSLNRLSVALAALKHGRPALDQTLADYKYLPLNILKTQSKHTSSSLKFSSEFRATDLEYSYPETDFPAIQGVSFSIEKGQFVGVVGPSGAGKTTLADILLGLLKVNSGRFLLDGRELDPTALDWRKLVSYVSQDTTVTDDTIRRNVAFGISDDEIDDEQVERALQLASLTNVVNRLPGRLETRLGERGTRLSGGQKQRICIARALYNDPQIIIMDEPTSALDTEVEKEIIDAIFSLTDEKAVIIIAHRLSTVRRCDQVLYLDGGNLVDKGTFNEIRSRNDNLAKMVALADVSDDEEPLFEKTTRRTR